MKRISLTVSDAHYETLRRASARLGLPIADVLRLAMGEYARRLGVTPRLTEIRPLVGVQLIGKLPSRAEVQEEVFEHQLPLPSKRKRTKRARPSTTKATRAGWGPTGAKCLAARTISSCASRA